MSIFSLGALGSDLAHFLGDWSQSEKLSEPLTFFKEFAFKKKLINDLTNLFKWKKLLTCNWSGMVFLQWQHYRVLLGWS